MAHAHGCPEGAWEKRYVAKMEGSCCHGNPPIPSTLHVCMMPPFQHRGLRKCICYPHCRFQPDWPSHSDEKIASASVHWSSFALFASRSKSPRLDRGGFKSHERLDIRCVVFLSLDRAEIFPTVPRREMRPSCGRLARRAMSTRMKHEGSNYTCHPRVKAERV